MIKSAIKNAARTRLGGSFARRHADTGRRPGGQRGVSDSRRLHARVRDGGWHSPPLPERRHRTVSDARPWRRSIMVRVASAQAASGCWPFGHGWGGILGIEYAPCHPDRLSAFMLSNMTASIDDYLAYTIRLRAALPKRTRKDLYRLEVAGEAGGQEFSDIIMRDLNPRHVLPKIATRTLLMGMRTTEWTREASDARPASFRMPTRSSAGGAATWRCRTIGKPATMRCCDPSEVVRPP
jgi:pimeloyl-ACP methyl ester carboxylesterase